MKKYYNILILVGLGIMISSCKKYVELTPKGQLVPQQVNDYRFLLNNSSNLVPAYGTNEFGTDDVDMDVSPLNIQLGTFYSNVVTWQKAIFPQTSPDFDWDNLYKIIYNSNIVITGVPTATDGTAAVKNELIGEALVHRSFAYFALVNQYGKQYNKTTSASDLGVPLVLTPLLQSNLTRASIQKVYDQILSDLNLAIGYLPATQPNTVYPSKCAAYALLARVDLFMANYTDALIQAKNALAIQNTLLDLQTYISNPNSLPAQIADPEIILLKQSNVSYYNPVRLSDELLNLLGTNDLRYQLFTVDGTSNNNYFYTSFPGRAYIRSFIDNEAFSVGLSVPELILTKAECEARGGDATSAINDVNSIRIKRYQTASYAPEQASNATDALQKVLDERRRELFLNGLRWFDLKRLNADPAFSKILTHTFSGNTYTLAPTSNHYVFPIAPSIILLSPQIIQNPRD